MHRSGGREGGGGRAFAPSAEAQTHGQAQGCQTPPLSKSPESPWGGCRRRPSPQGRSIYTTKIEGRMQCRGATARLPTARTAAQHRSTRRCVVGCACARTPAGTRSGAFVPSPFGPKWTAARTSLCTACPRAEVLLSHALLSHARGAKGATSDANPVYGSYYALPPLLRAGFRRATDDLRRRTTSRGHLFLPAPILTARAPLSEHRRARSEPGSNACAPCGPLAQPRRRLRRS